MSLAVSMHCSAGWIKFKYKLVEASGIEIIWSPLQLSEQSPPMTWRVHWEQQNQAMMETET